MMAQEILQQRRDTLLSIIRASFSNNLHSDAFAVRVLGASSIQEIVEDFQFDLVVGPDEVGYQGFPCVAYLGFSLGSEDDPSNDAIESFAAGVKRLQQRSESGLATFLSDDVAVLGVADGIACLIGREAPGLIGARDWLLGLMDATSTPKQWSGRMRALAGDLLDNRGRLRILADINSIDALALEIALRSAWPKLFLKTPPLTDNQRNNLLKSLLTQMSPQIGDLERATVWLAALDILVDRACQSLSPSISDTARILANVQHSMKRWVWKERPRRKDTMPSRWLIDDEYDVQALLWAVLYPIYGSELVDETYLPNWGNVQPRADLGIIKLKLIIEVKMVRRPGDFAKIEEEVGGDLGLYFKDPSQFDRMIVLIYDDCDRSLPERYDSLKNALMKRERIEDVIIVRRPSMLPNRNERNFV